MVEERDILQAAPEVRERDWGGRRALIGLPLKLVDRVSGVLFLYSNNPGSLRYREGFADHTRRAGCTGD